MPATLENIETVFRSSEFVVLGTHGNAGYIISDDRAMVGPDKIQNNLMKHIYFGACEMGNKRNEWELKFPNAKVIGYDGFTYQFTGWTYLVFKSWLDLIRIEK